MIYAVRQDKKVYKQVLSTMSIDEDRWEVASTSAVEAIAVYKGIIYAAGADRRLWKQSVANMTVNTTWELTSRPAIVGVSIDPITETVYGVGLDMALYKQPLASLAAESQWQAASKGSVERIAIHGGVVYGVAYDKRLWRQTLSSMTPQTEWTVASRDAVNDADISYHGLHAFNAVEGSRGSASPLEFVQGDVLHEIDNLEDVSVLFLSSLHFDTSLLLGLGWAMSATLRPGTLVFSQRGLVGCFPGLLHIGTVDVATTWSNESEVQAYVVTPPPLVPQPAWLVSRGPALDALLAALRETPIADANAVPREAWVAAAKRAWPGSDGVMLWRLVVAAAPTLYAGDDGFAAAPLGGGEVAPLALLEAVARERLAAGGPTGSAAPCAFRTIVAAARVAADAAALANSTDVVPMQQVSMQAIVARIMEPGLADGGGYNLASLAAMSLDEKLALQVLSALIEGKAAVDATEPSGLRPLHHAARQGHLEVVRLLLERQAPAQVLDSGAQQPLHVAAMHGHHAMVQLLLDKGAGTEVADAQGRLPRHVAPLKDANMSALLSGAPAAPSEPVAPA